MTPGTNVGRAQFSVDELRAIVEDAHRLGRRVAAHCLGTEGIANAVDAGVDTVEHCNWLDAGGGAVAFDEGVARRMAERGIYRNMATQPSRVLAEKPRAPPSPRPSGACWRRPRSAGYWFRRGHRARRPFLLLHGRHLRPVGGRLSRPGLAHRLRRRARGHRPPGGPAHGDRRPGQPPWGWATWWARYARDAWPTSWWSRATPCGRCAPCWTSSPSTRGDARCWTASTPPRAGLQHGSPGPPAAAGGPAGRRPISRTVASVYPRDTAGPWWAIIDPTKRGPGPVSAGPRGAAAAAGDSGQGGHSAARPIGCGAGAEPPAGVGGCGGWSPGPGLAACGPATGGGSGGTRRRRARAR